MRRFLFVRLVAILACFVTGGLIAGVAVAGADMEIRQDLSAFGDGYEGEEVVFPEDNNKNTIVSLAGDVLLASGVGTAINANGPDFPWQDTARLFKNSDLAIANLECSVSRRGEPVPDKQFTFRADPDAIDGAANAGIDIFTLANNHVLDFGRAAFLDTLDSLARKNIRYTGAGKNEAEAFKPVFIERNGLKIAVLAYTRVIPETGWIAAKDRPGVASGYNSVLMSESIKAAREKANIVIVCIHWGQELDDYPNREEISLAHSLVDGGADLVVGHHPHILQGVEFYKGKLIAYSLGNFIFTSSSVKAREGAILQVIFDGEGRYTARLVPTFISGGSTAILRGSDRKRVLSRVSGLSDYLGARVLENGSIESIKKDGEVN